MRAFGGGTASALAFGVLISGSRCRPPAPAPPPARTPPGPAASSPAPLASPTPAPSRWARETLAHLTLEQKVAQMIGVRAFGLYRHPSSKESRQLRSDVETLGVGSICVFESEVESVPRVVNELQRLAEGAAAGGRRHGARHLLPRAAGRRAAALRDGHRGDALRRRGALHGRGDGARGRALGIHWAFAPVADVNNNPANPVINIRSFGEDPELVARMVAAFVRGARSGGLLTTAKHFPGHGDTELDTHLKLASVGGDRARLDAVELLPFRRAIEAGVDSVMLGHIAVPSLDATGAPATLSADRRRPAARRAGLPGPDRHRRAGDGRGVRGLDGRGRDARACRRART